MCSGRQFQICAAATGIARLPTAESLTGGTTSRLVPEERSARRPGWGVARYSLGLLSNRNGDLSQYASTQALVTVAGPTVWNSLPDSLRDPAVESERFSTGLENAALYRTYQRHSICHRCN